MEFILTSPSEEAVRVIAVAGTLAELFGAKESPGCVAADTTKPLPAGTAGAVVVVVVGGVVVVVIVVVVGTPATIELYFACEIEPK